MRGLLPSVWLLGAALYSTSIVCLTQPFASDDEYWPAPWPVHETVVAKRPLVPPRTAAEPEVPLVLAAAVVPKPKVERRDEWVQVGGYTTVVRSRPSADAPPLYAYSAGRPLRVIAREGHFVRVQDLGSGQLGWIEGTSLVPFFGGYRQREPVAAPPVVAVATPPAIASEPVAAAAILPAPVAEPVVATASPLHVATASSRKLRKPREQVLAAKPGKDAVATNEPVERGLFRKKRGGVQRVALSGKQAGFGGLIGRAFRGF